ncbi:MAG: type II secretion system ATPase GspE [Nitrospinales bacterium]
MLKKIDPVEKILLTHNKISPKALEEVKTNDFQNGKFLGKTLVEHGYIHSNTLLETLAQELDKPYLKLKDYPRDNLPVPDLEISAAFMKEKVVFPLSLENDVLTLAVFNPFDFNSIEDLQISLGRPIQTALSSEEDILEAIETFYGEGGSALDRMIDDIEEEEADNLALDSESAEHIRDMASEAPVIKLVNHIISQAIESGASDIHIEPFADDLILRYRIDGVLHDLEAPPKKLFAAITSRIKIMAKLDISERRLPQDGRIRIKTLGKDIDIRVSTLPTLYGESVVMRILDRAGVVVNLQQLGFPEKELAEFQALIQKPYGKLLVTGPTGSGKTTTLYAALEKINTPDKKIITIEDPVEYQLRGVNQIHVKPQIGLSFAGGLRAIVRQDPDVIMVGEIRDAETAAIAIQAALTGHMVFSTIHTNDAAGAITRLLDMGIENFLIASAVLGVLAQRLVRIICRHCKEEIELESAYAREMGDMAPDNLKVFHGKGCDHCSHTGYRGRKGIYELLIIDDAIHNLILAKASAHVIRAKARENGMRVLREDGWRKVLQGETTAEEVLRVTLNNEL